MAVKFKKCWRCKDVKSDPLEYNWIRPDQEVCTSCEREMYKLFLKGLGYSTTDVMNHFKEKEC